MRLYFHIPFCRQKCAYCKFALTPFVRDHEIRRYLGFLRAEVSSWLDENRDNDIIIDSVYFWGGTPSVLDIMDVESLLASVRGGARLVDNVEITFESNPEDLTETYVLWLASVGVTRLSLGVQTLRDETLKAVGRSGSDPILQAFDILGQHGGDLSISLDFIAWLPDTDVDTARNDIRRALSCLDAEHISLYMLESGRYPGSFDFPEDEIFEAYTLAADELSRSGFNRYEISNFARPGSECRHNQWYWRHDPYRWFGLSAASFDGRVRRENSASFVGYYRWDCFIETLSDEQLRIERVMFSLRTDGVKESDIGDHAWLVRLMSEGVVYRGACEKIFVSSACIFSIDSIMATLL